MIAKKVARNAQRAGRKTKAANIRDLTEYIAAPGAEEKVLYENGRNFLGDTLPEQQAEMIALAERALRSPNPVCHYILSWREGEQPTREQAEGVVSIVLEELGLEGHQAIYGLHRDTDNVHLHLAVNRVHPETQRLVRANGGFDIEAIHKAIARIEHDQGWQPERNARYTVIESGAIARRTDQEPRARQPGQKGRDFEQRTGLKSNERIAMEQVLPLIREARSWPELHERLEHVGARIERKGSGGILWVNGQPVKPSALGREASFRAIEKRLGAYGAAPGVGEGTQGPSDVRAGRPTARVAPSSASTFGCLSRPEAEERATLALPALRSARSWEEVHGQLHELGFRYERKGSGAVVRVGEHVIKASSIDRHVALGPMEKRIGLFRGAELSRSPARNAEGVSPRQEAVPLPSAPSDWKAYAEDRRRHREQREAAVLDLRKRHDAERVALRDAHRARREEILGMAENTILRMALRSVMAADHAGERAEMRDRMRQERKDLFKSFARYPDLETWLRARDATAADGWRYRASEPGRLEGQPLVPATPRDIRAFTATIDGRNVHYHRQSLDAATAFTDRGRAIHVHETNDRDTVLASLQLAAQKWGRFNVAGDERFKAEAVRLAVEHGFRIGNPELQDQLRAARDAFQHRPATGAADRDSGGPDVRDAGVPRGGERSHSLRGMTSERATGSVAVTAYYEHLQDVSKRLTGVADESRLDAMIAVRLRATGHDRDSVVTAIERCAPTIRTPGQQESHRWSDYAQRTAAFAFGAGGDRQLEKTVRFHDHWRALEPEPVRAPRAHPRSARPPDGPEAPGV